MSMGIFTAELEPITVLYSLGIPLGAHDDYWNFIYRAHQKDQPCKNHPNQKINDLLF